MPSILAGNLALVNGNASSVAAGYVSTTGFVMLKLRGTWGTVCISSGSGGSGGSGSGDWRQWSAANAQVVCRQLGLPWSGAANFTGPLGPVDNSTTNFSSSPVAVAVDCVGTESQLEDCPMFWGVPDSLRFGCISSSDVAGSSMDAA